jgi:hypothetical protein
MMAGISETVALSSFKTRSLFIILPPLSRLFTMSRAVSLACCRRRHHTPNDGSRPVPVLYPMQMERGVVLVPDKVTLCFGRL